MMGARTLLLLGLFVCSTLGLDLAIRGFSCDENLAVSIVKNTLELTCQDARRTNVCTFGETGLLQGQLQYNGVDLWGLDGNTTTYIAGELDVSVDVLRIPDGMSLDLCNDGLLWVDAVDNSTSCPGDGIYNFEAALTLPHFEGWWYTGWFDQGNVALYADDTLDTLIGSCTVYYMTQITSSSAIFHAPSAFTTLFCIGSVFLVGATWACYYITCIYKPRRKRYLEDFDGDSTHNTYKSMDKDLHSPSEFKPGHSSDTKRSTSPEKEKDATPPRNKWRFRLVTPKRFRSRDGRESPSTKELPLVKLTSDLDEYEKQGGKNERGSNSKQERDQWRFRNVEPTEGKEIPPPLNMNERVASLPEDDNWNTVSTEGDGRKESSQSGAEWFAQTLGCSGEQPQAATGPIVSPNWTFDSSIIAPPSLEDVVDAVTGVEDDSLQTGEGSTVQTGDEVTAAGSSQLSTDGSSTASSISALRYLESDASHDKVGSFSPSSSRPTSPAFRELADNLRHFSKRITHKRVRKTKRSGSTGSPKMEKGKNC